MSFQRSFEQVFRVRKSFLDQVQAGFCQHTFPVDVYRGLLGSQVHDAVQKV